MRAEKAMTAESSLNFDPYALADVIRRAMGDRNVLTYSKDSGVSRELLGMMAAGKVRKKPTIKTLMKLVSEEAKPANGVDLNMLLRAVGYLPEKDGEKGIQDAEQAAYDAAPAESPTRAMSLMVDELIKRGFDRSYSVEAREGIFAVRGASSGERVVIVDGFAGRRKSTRAMSVIIKSMLLDSVVADLNSNQLDRSAYAIVTDRRDVFDEIVGLPRFAAKDVVVAMADPGHRKLKQFLSIKPDGGTTDWTMGGKVRNDL